MTATISAGNKLMMLISLILRMLIPNPISRIPPTPVNSAIMLPDMNRIIAPAKSVRPPW